MHSLVLLHNTSARAHFVECWRTRPPEYINEAGYRGAPTLQPATAASSAPIRGTLSFRYHIWYCAAWSLRAPLRAPQRRLAARSGRRPARRGLSVALITRRVIRTTREIIHILWRCLDLGLFAGSPAETLPAGLRGRKSYLLRLMFSSKI